MKVFKRIIKILLGLVLLVLAVTLLIWLKPSLVLNDRSLQWALQKQSSISVVTGINKILLRANKNGFSRLVIELSIVGPVCIGAGVIKDSPSKPFPVKSCLEKFSVQFELHLTSSFQVRLSQFGPIELSATDLMLGPFPTSSAPKAQEIQPGTAGVSVFDFLRNRLDREFKLNQVNIFLPSIKVFLPNPWLGKLSLNTRFQINSERAFVAEATVLGLEKETFNLDGTFSIARDSRYDSHLALKLAIGKSIRGNIKLHGDGVLEAGDGHWAGSGKLSGVADFISRIEVPSIDLIYGKEPRLKLGSWITLDLGQPRREKNSAVSPIQLNPKLKLNIELENIRKSPDYRFLAELLPLEEYGVRVQGKIAGTTTDDFDWKKMRYSAAHFEIRVPKFQTTVQALRNSQAAVPAPLNALDGELHLKIGTEEKISNALNPDLPIDLGVALKSRNQRVQVRATGHLLKREAPAGFRLAADAVAEEFTLQLPQIDPLGDLPALTRDSRIQKEKAAVKEAIPEGVPFFDAKIHIHTGSPGIALLYEHFEPAALLGTDLRFDSENGLTGEISTRPFRVRFLHQTAFVERLTLQWKPESEGPQIIGRFRMARTDYTIFADVTQNELQKTIVLSSDPPLPQADIISVLLFDQISSGLDPQDAQSAQATQSAIAARALGVFTLWALSSTPIEAVKYNPTTQTYSAKVRIASGLRAEVGSDWDNSQIYGLRKRLGKDWVLSTQIRTESGGQQLHESFVEWVRRF